MPFDGIVTKAVVEELEELLIPGKITKVYQPTTTEILLIVRSNRKKIIHYYFPYILHMQDFILRMIHFKIQKNLICFVWS